MEFPIFHYVRAKFLSNTIDKNKKKRISAIILDKIAVFAENI